MRHDHPGAGRVDGRGVRRARQLVDGQLARWGLPELSETTRLLVSRVVTNGVRHAGGRPVELRLVRGDTLLCEVSDEDHTLPLLRDARPEEECGRGLRLVSRLAHRWASEPLRGGQGGLVRAGTAAGSAPRHGERTTATRGVREGGTGIGIGRTAHRAPRIRAGRHHRACRLFPSVRTGGIR